MCSVFWIQLLGQVFVFCQQRLGSCVYVFAIEIPDRDSRLSEVAHRWRRCGLRDVWRLRHGGRGSLVADKNVACGAWSGGGLHVFGSAEDFPIGSQGANNFSDGRLIAKKVFAGIRQVGTA